MKKALLAILSAVFVVITVQPVQAEDQKVLVIIDSAINSNNFPQIIHEVCFTTVSSQSCPNKQLFMEGKGAASATWPTSLNNGTYHGDYMVKAALVTNPNIKIVFIRVYNVDSLGNSNVPSNGITIASAMKWVYANSSKYSIDAVSISLSGIHTNLLTKVKDWHYQCSNREYAGLVSQLSTSNIPVFAATGNDGVKNVVGFPACIPGVIGVGSATEQFDNGTQVGETSTNRGPGLDMVAIGRVSVTKYNGSPVDIGATSGATVVSASTYIKNNTRSTFTEYLNYLPKQSIKFVDYFINNPDKTRTIVWEPARLLSFSSK